MVAKISIGSSLYGALAYNAQKVNAGEGKLLAVNAVFDACTGKSDLARTFKDFDSLLPKGIRTEKPVLHVSLNPHPDDRLTDIEQENIAREYMEEMGYGSQPYMVFKHEDIDRHHVHIVSVNVDEKGKRIDRDFLFRRSERIRKKLEKEFNLHPDERKTAKTVFRGTPTSEKTEKTANSVDGIIRNRRKLQIPWAESSKNGKNYVFCGRNHQKSLKTANSVDRIIKKRKKPAFPTLGKIKITRFLRFPTLGKVRITRFLRFPTLGKVKITHFLRFSLERKAVVAHRKRP